MGESDIAVLILLFLVLAFLMISILGPRKVWELGRKNICHGIFIVISGSFDACERWLTRTFLPASYPRLEDFDMEGDDTQKEESKIQNLEHLEKLSKEGRLKRPTWVLVVLGLLSVWQILFLVYFNFGEITYETIQHCDISCRLKASGRKNKRSAIVVRRHPIDIPVVSLPMERPLSNIEEMVVESNGMRYTHGDDDEERIMAQ